jgi:cytochrome P450 family 9
MNGKPVTYEALHKMKFLDQVISEVLRLHPPVPFTTRECNKDYVMQLSNGQSIPVKKGENILIPVRSIQRDEKFFENPDNFDPHRFDDDKKDSIVQGSFIPFGEFFEDCFVSKYLKIILCFHLRFRPTSVHWFTLRFDGSQIAGFLHFKKVYYSNLR